MEIKLKISKEDKEFILSTFDISKGVYHQIRSSPRNKREEYIYMCLVMLHGKDNTSKIKKAILKKAEKCPKKFKKNG